MSKNWPKSKKWAISWMLFHLQTSDFILGTKVQTNKAHSMTQVSMTFGVWVTKEFCDSMFLSISVKNGFFFFSKKPIYFMLFMRLGPWDHFTKSCPADKTLTLKNFNSKLFLNHLINLLHILYDGKTN